MIRLRSFLDRRLVRGTAGDEGFTIIEVMVAMVIFAIVSVGIAAGITSSLVLSKDTRSREVASTLISADFDALRQYDDISKVTSLDSSSALVTVIGNTTYKLTRVTNFVDTSGTIGACGTGNNNIAYKTVYDTVTWSTPQSGGGTLHLSTQIAPTDEINLDTAGTIIVGVSNANGTGESGVTVSVTPASGVSGNTAVALSAQPATTDSSGCTIALFVTPGTYTLNVSNANSIDNTQVAAPTATVQVSAGQTSKKTFVYDQSAAVSFRYASNWNGVGANPTAVLPKDMPVSLLSQSGGYSTFANTPTTVQAFPFTDGYRGIAGKEIYSASGGTGTCIDPDQANWTTIAADGSVGVAEKATAVTPSGSATVPVPMGILTVNGIKAGAVLKAVTATATTGDPGCATAMTLTFPAATGTSMLIALPYGTWSLYNGTTLITPSDPATVHLQTKGTINTVSVLGVVTLASPTITLDPRKVPGT